VGRTARLTAALVVVVSLLAAGAACSTKSGNKDIVVGKPDPATTVAPPAPDPPLSDEDRAELDRPAPAPGQRPRPEPGPAVGLKAANGRPYGPSIPFVSSIPVSPELRFVLVIGSDARPREDIRRSRADSIHVVAINPRSGQGTVLGIPRDTYVEIPGKGKGKINDALFLGGPKLLAETVRRLTGLPVDYYVLTGFSGLIRLVDELGGVHVFVERRMNDRFSGARFQPGWHLMNGTDALAFSRDRHDVPYGDFSRSQNHGHVILSALGKMRSEVADDDGIMHWVSVLLRHVELDLPRGELPELAALARRIDPTRMTNVVAEGSVSSAGGASVVVLSKSAYRLFEDLRADAVVGAAEPPPTTTSTTTTTSSTSSTSTTSPSTTTTSLL
jgi:polyisoprenyl-teichoic acid--peptidoglycan teichoic acid transferase